MSSQLLLAPTEEKLVACCFRQAIDNGQLVNSGLRSCSHLEKENQEPVLLINSEICWLQRREKHATFGTPFSLRIKSESAAELHSADWLRSTGIWICGDDGTSHQRGGRETETLMPMLSSARKRQSKADLSGSHIRD